MNGFPILTALIVTPIIGALLVLFTPARRPEIARAVGYLTSVATLGFAGWLLWDFQTGVRTFQFVEENRWFDALGVGYIVGVDGFSIFMVAITALLFPIGLLAAAKQDIRVKAYTFWFLLLEGVIMGIFLSLDLICFFVFWEAMLVPMYFLISGWGSERRVYAAMKFFIYTAVRIRVPARVDPGARVPAPERDRAPHVRLPGPRGLERPRVEHREAAVPRVHDRLRDQGAAVPVPHLARPTCTPRPRPRARSCWPA